MTIRSRWLDWTPPRPTDEPTKPTEGALVSFDGASAMHSQNTNPQCSLEVKVEEGGSYFPKPLRKNPPKPTKAIGVNYEAIYLGLTVDAGTAEDLAAIGHHVARNGFWVAEEIAWLDRRCDRLARTGADVATYRAAVLVLVARADELRRSAEGTASASARRWLSVTVNAPVAGPITLPDGTVIENVGRFVGRLFTAVDYVLGRNIPDGDAVVEIYLGHLATLGIAAHVEAAQ